jgi:hypothetical protein
VIDGAPIAGSAHGRPRARPAPTKPPDPLRRKVRIMKTPFIALAFAVAATAATAQLASPITPGAAPTTRADPGNTEIDRAQLRMDREKIKADQDKLRTAREAHDDDAIRLAQAALRTDMAAWRADRDRLADTNSSETLKR